MQSKVIRTLYKRTLNGCTVLELLNVGKSVCKLTHSLRKFIDWVYQCKLNSSNTTYCITVIDISAVLKDVLLLFADVWSVHKGARSICQRRST